MRKLLRNYAIYLAWLVALLATGGSLYFSEIAGYVPCKLCWFQRTFMYPLAVMLGVATYYDDRSAGRYSLALSLLGSVIGAIQVAEQKVPGFHGPLSCGPGESCTTQWINWFGFVTIPLLSLVAFVVIAVLSYIMLTSQYEGEDGEAERASSSTHERA